MEIKLIEGLIAARNEIYSLTDYRVQIELPKEKERNEEKKRKRKKKTGLMLQLLSFIFNPESFMACFCR